MSTVDVDSRGRVYIPKEMREDLGDSFKIVKVESGIKLIPLDDDPVEGLKEALNHGENLDVEDLDIEEKVRKELKEDL
jgi:AbrB family looped-hinge helix DNA binding protein